MQRLRRLLVLLVLPLALAACGGAEPIWAPDDVVSSAAYRAAGPSSVTLMTVISTGTESGAHSGLIINGSQRVLWDPAGTFKHPHLPERNDVHYGVTDPALAVYIDYHARETYYVVTQKIEVTREVADLLIARAEAYGAVPKAQCSQSTSAILRMVPGFESVSPTWFPKKLMADFGRIPGVVAETIHDDDADDNRYVLYVRPEVQG